VVLAEVLPSTAPYLFVRCFRTVAKSSCYFLHVRLSACMRALLDGFLWNLIFRTFTKYCLQNQNLVIIGHKCRTLYMKTKQCLIILPDIHAAEKKKRCGSFEGDASQCLSCCWYQRMYANITVKDIIAFKWQKRLSPTLYKRSGLQRCLTTHLKNEMCPYKTNCTSRVCTDSGYTVRIVCGKGRV